MASGHSKLKCSLISHLASSKCCIWHFMIWFMIMSSILHTGITTQILCLNNSKLVIPQMQCGVYHLQAIIHASLILGMLFSTFCLLNSSSFNILLLRLPLSKFLSWSPHSLSWAKGISAHSVNILQYLWLSLPPPSCLHSYLCVLSSLDSFFESKIGIFLNHCIPMFGTW